MSKKNRDEIIDKLREYRWNPPKLDDLKIAETDDPAIRIVFQIDKKFFVASKTEKSARYFPLLRDEQILPLLPVVRVDSGAVKFVCNGANIMRPGIIDITGELSKSSHAVIREQKYGKAISVGRAMSSRDEIESMSKGSVIENLHYVGDKYWEALKELAK